MSTIKERIKLLRKEKDLTQEELAKLLGLNAKSNIANYENGANAPSDEIKNKLCELFNVSMDYLMGRVEYRHNPYEYNFLKDMYEDPFFINLDFDVFLRDFFDVFWGNISDIKKVSKKYPKEYKTAIENILNDISKNRKFVPREYNDSNMLPLTDTPISVPVLGKISAGLPLLATENIEGHEFAPSSYIKEGFDYFYLRVNGDSMNLKFHDGDIVLVQKQDNLENDEIGVVLVDGMDATVKKYKYENGFVILSPMSTNQNHVVQIYNPKDISIRIIGKVVSYQGKV